MVTNQINEIAQAVGLHILQMRGIKDSQNIMSTIKGLSLSSSAVIQSINEILYNQMKFTGNSEDYYNPNNSYIDKVSVFVYCVCNVLMLVLLVIVVISEYAHCTSGLHDLRGRWYEDPCVHTISGGPGGRKFCILDFPRLVLAGVLLLLVITVPQVQFLALFLLKI